MSYIDTFEHEFIGFFGGLPIYHPLEEVIGDSQAPASFSCNPNNLVIGGGEGEHPALVLERPDCAVVHFVTSWLKSSPKSLPDVEHVNESLWYAPWDDYIDDLLDVQSGEVFSFVEWDVKTYYNFYNRCISSRMFTPYEPGLHGWFEWWVAGCLGELIFFSLPDLVPNLPELLPQAYDIIQQPLYVNVVTPTPGVKIPYGRIRVNNQFTQGYSRWWDRDK